MALVVALLLIVLWMLAQTAVITALVMLVMGGLHHIWTAVPAPGFVTLFPVVAGLVLLSSLLFNRIEVAR